VDAVAVNEFHAVAKLFELGLTEEVVPLPKPLSIYSLHVAAPKIHWRATSDIARVNDGLARLHQSGAYAAIVDRHLQGFWAELRARRP
jgi:polar amino acid transport system substrate-binding protein